MERVLSSRFAGSRVRSRSLRAYPRRRRRRSICPISAVARLECAPSAAYPLSPRRREIFRPPLLDRAGADVNVIRSTIYSGSSTSRRTSPGKRYAKDATTQIDGDPRWGGRRGGRRGHPSKSSRPPANRLDKTLVRTDWLQCLHISHLKRLRIIDHFAPARAGVVGPGSGPPQSRR
jgi:hypothetical protein